MGNRSASRALAGLLLSGSVSAPLGAAPPEPLPAEQLDWQPWGQERPAGAVCRGRYRMPDYRLAEPEGNQVVTEADDAQYGEDGRTVLSGEVVLRRRNTQLEAPRIRVPASRERVQVEGPLALREQGLLVRGAEASYSLQGAAASIDRAHYVFHEHRLRGEASRLARVAEGRYQLNEATFTTCEPGNKLWRLVGEDIQLDQQSGFATARHARLEVGDVPVFYWPWMRFPIDERRQSGFLWPTLGVSGDGLDYAQPYYWNIAPNQDATLTPRLITDRGLLLGGQYRYLLPTGGGALEGAYLFDDQRAGDEASDFTPLASGDDRWYLDYRHAGRLDERTRYRLRYGAASDVRYFDDFGAGFQAMDRNSMRRLALVEYRGDTWQLAGKAEGYQVLEDPLNPNDKPFYRLPSLTAKADWQAGNLYADWSANATYFWRDQIGDDLGRYTYKGQSRQVSLREAANGARLQLTPALGWRGESTWGFFEPRLQLHHTSYALDYGQRDTQRDESLTRSLPVVSLDTGVILERDMEISDTAYRQTLEPRFNYAFVPGEDQSEYPDFDTSEETFSWQQLWSPYRFSGGDRVGDLNRLSYGVKTRFFEDRTGRERFSLGVGQAAYFEDRNVDMAGDPETLPVNRNARYRATRYRSPWVTQLEWQLNDQWNARTSWLYDDQRERTESTGLDLQYRAEAGHVVNLGYRWQIEGFEPTEDLEDTRNYDREEFSASFAYQALSRLDLVGGVRYDNTNRRMLEQLAGVQWNDCCYGLQLVWREWVDDENTANNLDDDTTDRGLFLRFAFKGLGGVGGETGRFFESAVPGYRPADFGRP
ncbi:LPS-assembly protein LptD [Halomonas sp. 18H]|nr:LPS-assembly protein LptD [Halomonas sp. 18H]MCW4149442.1 LPS-assembly protein LptD [Halomonas sp. 18H]